MMEILNTKTGLARKAKTVTGAVMALSAAVAMAMVPTSQAFAYQSYQAPRALATGKNFTVTFKGHGNTLAKAQADAWNGARCDVVLPGIAETGTRVWRKPVTMYNGTWFNAFLVLTCKG